MDNYTLFQRYLDVCNRALDRNKDKFPYKQILIPENEEKAHKIIEVSIIDDVPQDRYLLIRDGDRLKATVEDRKCSPNCSCDGRWKINKSYLQDVINHPEDYIQNPAKIDWEWMQEG